MQETNRAKKEAAQQSYTATQVVR